VIKRILKKINHKLLGLSFIVLLLMSSVLKAEMNEESKAAISLRIAVCKRALTFERAFYKKDSVYLALVYDDLDEEYINNLLNEFNDNNIVMKPIKFENIESRLSDFDGVYFEQSVDAEKLSTLVKSNHKLSVTNAKDFVEEGYATLGVFFDEGKIKILINQKSANAEQKEFFGEILPLSEIIDE